MLENFERPYLCNGSSVPQRVCSTEGFGVGGSKGAIYGWRKSKMAAGRHLTKCRMTLFLQPVMRFTLRLVLWSGFGSADRMSLLPVGPNPRWRPAVVLEIFEWPYFCNGSRDLLRVWFCGRVSGRRIECLYFRLVQIQDRSR